MGEPDVRWDAVSHEQIERWTRHGRGASVTEQLEARLAAITEALDEISDDVNATLQRVNGGEWTGNAAMTAAAAMQAMRDFDDLMGHHGRMNVLAAFGQSDNASWAKVNVPPYVDVRAARVPTGTPLDAVNATADYHQELQAAKDAEERARQVMREYQAMTTTRIAALPPLSPAPRVVVTTGDDIAVPSGDPGLSGGPAAPRGTRSGDGGPGAGSPPAERPGDPAPGSSGAPASPPTTPTTLPAGRAGAASSASAPDATLPTPATSAAAASAGDMGTDVVPGPLPGRGQPGGGPGGGPVGGPGGAAPRETALPIGGRGGGPGGGPVGAAPRENALRSGERGGGGTGQAVRGAGPYGLAPGATRKEEDEERRGRYAVPGSEIFEPDHDDGLLHDPFRPGSYVAPASIGDDDE